MKNRDDVGDDDYKSSAPSARRRQPRSHGDSPAGAALGGRRSQRSHLHAGLVRGGGAGLPVGAGATTGVSGPV